MSNPLDLHIDLQGVSTKTPVIPAGDQPFSISKVEVDPSKSDPSKKNLKITFALAQAVVTTEGAPINAGYPLVRYYPLQQSDNPKAPDYRRDICVLVDAVYGSNDDNRPPLNGETLTGLMGRQVIANVTIEQTQEYGPQNRIGRIKPMA